MNSIVPHLSRGELAAAFKHGPLMSWSSSKLASNAIAEKYLQSPYPQHLEYARRISQCAPDLTFRLKLSHRPKNPADPFSIHEPYVKSSLENAYCCRCRNCAVCTKARVRKQRAKLFQAFELMGDRYAGYHWIFLTLTTKQPEISQTRQHLQQMNDAWNRLRGYKEFPALGFIRSFEFTGPKQEGGGKWESGPMHVHPHFHALLLVAPSYFDGKKAYITQERWRQLWQRALKSDYLPVVYVKKISASNNKRTTTLEAAVLETVKYSVKPTSLAEAPPIWLADITTELHGSRTLTIGGCFSEFVTQAELNRIEDNLKAEDEVKQEGELFTFKWDGEEYQNKNFGVM